MTRQTREWSCGDLTPEDLPAGKYLVSYRTWEKRSYWNQLKIRLDFVIVEPASACRVPLVLTNPLTRACENRSVRPELARKIQEDNPARFYGL
jgi:hypothetical protein